jgi:hypothetical protein
MSNTGRGVSQVKYESNFMGVLINVPTCKKYQSGLVFLPASVYYTNATTFFEQQV